MFLLIFDALQILEVLIAITVAPWKHNTNYGLILQKVKQWNTISLLIKSTTRGNYFYYF